EPEAKNLKVGPHVFRARGPGEGKHTDIQREPENDLRGCSAVVACDPGNNGVHEHITIAGEEREALVDDVIHSTERADLTVPPADGVTAILHEPRAHPGAVAQFLELFEGDVAHPE